MSSFTSVCSVGFGAAGPGAQVNYHINSNELKITGLSTNTSRPNCIVDMKETAVHLHINEAVSGDLVFDFLKGSLSAGAVQIHIHGDVAGNVDIRGVSSVQFHRNSPAVVGSQASGSGRMSTPLVRAQQQSAPYPKTDEL